MAFGFDKLANLNPFVGGGTVAIDFGSQSLKLLQFTPGEPPQLVAAACVQTPPELANDASKRLEFQCEQLPQLMKTGGFKAKKAVVAIPAPQMFCKHLQLQLGEKESVETAAAQTIAAQLGCDASMLTCRSIVVNGASAGGKTEVIGLATATSLVNRIMQALRAARLEPIGMQSEVQALFAGFRPINRRSADADVTTLYLDIGAGCTKIVLGHGPDMAFAKAIPVGGRFLDQCVAQQAKCSMAEAHAVRLGLTSLTRAPGARPQAPDLSGMPALAAAMARDQAAAGMTATIAQPATGLATDAATAAHRLSSTSPAAATIDLSDNLRAITDEIAMCVRYYEEQLFPERRVTRAIFVGGESRHLPLCQHIARSVRLPAHSADPLARIARTGQEPVSGIDLTQPQPGWAVPVGLLLSPSDV